MGASAEVKDSTGYVSPLQGYLAEAKREAFLRGVDWAIDVLQRFRPGETVVRPEDIERAARAYAGLPVDDAGRQT